MTDYNHFFSKNAYNINPLILKFKKKKKWRPLKIGLVYVLILSFS